MTMQRPAIDAQGANLLALAERFIEKIEGRTAVVCILGMGYVGLPLAVAFAEAGAHQRGHNKV